MHSYLESDVLEETKVEERIKTTAQINILKIKHKAEVKELNERINSLEKENQLLKDDNERMKSIINNDSSNTSLPPSSDKNGKSANTYNSREKKGMDKKDIKEILLQEKRLKKRLKNAYSSIKL